MSVIIHNREYITVAERLTKAHAELKEISIITEVLFNEARVVIKATVTTPKGTFTGISAANINKLIEKESPYEVAETSAVGRALAFAGYETTLDIASAEEIRKADPIMKVTSYMNERPASENQKKMIFAVAKQKGIDSEKAKETIKEFFKLNSFEELTLLQAKKAIDNLLKKPDVEIPERQNET